MSAVKIADDSAQHALAIRIMDRLHRAGFPSLWLESVMMFSGGLDAGERPGAQVQHHHLRIVLSEDDISADRLEKVREIAFADDATVALTSLRLNGRDFSRITVWPVRS